LGAKNPGSQIFCVVYTLIGVPIIYSTMANIGKTVSELYTVDWLYFTAVVRGRVSAVFDAI
jgi:precorrin-2 methylase